MIALMVSNMVYILITVDITFLAIYCDLYRLYFTFNISLMNCAFTSRIQFSVQWRLPVVGLSKDEVVPGRPGGGMALLIRLCQRRWHGKQGGTLGLIIIEPRNWRIWRSTRH